MDAFPGGIADPATCSTRSCPTGPSSCPTATTTAPGSTPRRCELAGIDRSTAGPGGRPDRAGRRRRARRHAAGGRGQPGRRRSLPEHHRGRLVPRRCSTAQDHLLSLGITGWQDAIVGRYAGDGRPARSPTCRAGGGGHPAGHAWSARCGGTGTGGWSSSAGSSSSASTPAAGPFRATSVKIMQDGVAENRTAAMLEPYLDGDGCTHRQRRHSLHRPGELPRVRHRARPRGLPGALPRARRPRASANALDAVEAARAANGPGGRRHHLAHLQVVHPDDVAALRPLGADRQHPAAVGRARAADGRADDAVPRREAGRLAVPVRRSLQRGRRAPVPRAATGRSAARTRCSGAHVAVNRHLPARAGGGSAGTVPARAGPQPRRRSWPPTPPGSAWVNGLERSAARSPTASTPTWPWLTRIFPGRLPRRSAGAAVTQTWIRGQLVYQRG